MSFGRKQVAAPAAAPAYTGSQPRHSGATLPNSPRGDNDPIEGLKRAGHVLFDYVYRSVRDDRGARIEDVIGILAANGGFACIFGVLHFLDGTGGRRNRSAC